jgi:hypothetical protein
MVTFGRFPFKALPARFFHPVEGGGLLRCILIRFGNAIKLDG